MPSQIVRRHLQSKANAVHLMGCGFGRKRPYPSMAIAKQIASQSGTERGLALRVYKCKYCRYWHLTSQEPRSTK